MSAIRIAQSDEDIRRCHPVMAELRPHCGEKAFVEQVRRQQQACGYQLACLEDGGSVQVVAGFRIAEFLAWGRILYVDDLVTTAASRSRGYGRELFAWLVEQANTAGCDELHLDSGVQRFEAHRFYLAQRMDITCHHFCLKLK
jgi:GNAT superfamily N-acetyltransferase